MGHILTIESDEAFALASELAELTGTSLEAAVTSAIQSRLKFEHERQAWIGKIQALTAEFRATLTDPPTSSDHSFLYDNETGLPV
jgi:antitoxin VapB